MNKTKIWLIVALSLTVLGCIIFGGLMMALKWDFSKLSTVKYETTTFETDDTVYNIDIHSDTADIQFKISEDGKTKVVCYEETNAGHNVSMEEGILTIELETQKKWYEYININFSTPKITVYLPVGQYGDLIIRESTGDIEISEHFTFDTMDISLSTGDVKVYASASKLKIKGTTGNIHLKNVSAGTISLSVSTGKITAEAITCSQEFNLNVSTGKATLSDISCGSLSSTGSTGSITLTNLIAGNTISIVRTTGNVTLNQCDGEEIYIKTSTGSVSGSLNSEKVFITQTSSGSVNVPKTAEGGKCEITTTTGNIDITIN